MNVGDKDLVSIRCGNFALSKLTPMAGMVHKDEKSFSLNINGESVAVCHVPTLNKKQLIISNTHQFISNESDKIVHPDDIVLYFA